MKDWFESLQQREQWFISVGALLVVCAVTYAVVWVPLVDGRNTMAADVAAWQRSLAEIKQLKGLQPVAGASQQNRLAGAAQTPVIIVDQTLRARGLDRSLKRSQPTTNDGIRVEFENVVFDDLVLWLGDLSSQYGMQVTSGSMATTTEGLPGRINATFTLERA